MNYLWQQFPLLLNKLFEQIYLTGSALFISIIVSVPIGIWIARKTIIRQYVLGFASLLQTIPSLAVLGFLLPFLGIGVKTAIVTLTLYALLPILRNTVTGLLSVSPAMIEAADGLGFKPLQKLWMVELPLALPVIIAGIRTATAMSVGIATLAAFVGAGGLGDFIYQGLSLNDNRMILMGAIPAALLALILDYMIGRIEAIISERRYKKMASRSFVFITVIIIFFLLLFLIQPIYFKMTKPYQGSIRIATKNFTEQLILGEIMSQMIELKTHLKVIKKFNLGGTLVCHEALIKGDIDMYPEYTGTAFIVILKQKGIYSADQIYQLVKSAYLKNFDVEWLPPFGFNNTNAVAVRDDFSKRYSIFTISDLTPVANRLTMGVPPDFMQRPDGFPGLKSTYNLNFGNVRLMDPGLMYKAISNNQVDVIMAFSTDGRIAAYHLFLLKDDKQLFPPYFAAPIVRRATLQKYPEIFTALQPLIGLIDDRVMQMLNYQVDVEKRTPAEVANAFLMSHFK